ncbi:MAG: VCBS repeat-containing protein [Proteobacteria bacterium]|nr:VCBS repeat-containing protein [Pseudomonadota bacterium]
MRLIVLALLAFTSAAHGAEWRVERIDTPARVTGIETVDGKPRIDAGGLYYGVDLSGDKAKLAFLDVERQRPPENALPDGQVVTGTHDIARVWFASPTQRYDHAALGDAIEAGSLMIVTADGKTDTVVLGNDAVFEDLTPRLADLDGDGRDEIVVVKSYLTRGSAIAVIAQRKGRYQIVAETPPLGGPHRWENPAGIGDFNGDGKMDIAVVRQPHAVGALELWTYADGRLRHGPSLDDFSNHVAGTRALGMSAVADFDGDGTPDLALPSFDRTRLRIVAFKPVAQDIASIKLPSDARTNIGVIARDNGPPALLLGLADGSLVVIRRY